MILDVGINRRKKIIPGSLMKALMRPGGGESNPSDGDQVCNPFVLSVSVSIVRNWIAKM